MADKPTSQTQQNPSSSTGNGIPHIPPFAADAVNGFRKMMDEQITRFAQMTEEMAKLEQKSLDQARQAVDEACKLAKESLGYYSQLTAEWRKLALDATKRGADFFNVKA